MGHKYIEPPAYMDYKEETILHSSEHPFGNRLMNLIKENSKAKFYMCSHGHLSDVSRLEEGTGIWQIITGNGGAPLTEAWQPEGGPYFGYDMLDIYESGKIILSEYGRPLPPAPQKFYEDSPVPPTIAAIRKQVVISED